MRTNPFVATACVALILLGALGAGCWSPRLAPVTVQVPVQGRHVRVGKFVAKGGVSPDKVRTLRRSVICSLKASGFARQKGREDVTIAVVVNRFRDTQYPQRYTERDFLTALLTLGFVIPLWERHSLGEIRVTLLATFPEGRVVRRVFAAWSSARCRIGVLMWALPVVTVYCRQVVQRAQERLIREILEALEQLLQRGRQKAATGRVTP